VAEAHEKRKRKMETLKNALPEPELMGNPDAKITIVGWGSTKMEVMDFVQKNKAERIKNKEGFENSPLVKGGEKTDLHWGVMNYLHYTHIWPLKVETIKKLQKKGNRIIVMEHNMTGQLATLIRSE